VSERHLSPLDLDALLLPGLRAEERAAVEGHLAGCAACRQRHQAGVERQAAFAETVLPRGLVRLERVRGPALPRWLLLGIALPAAAALAIVAGTWSRPERAGQDRGLAALGVKGPTALRLVVRRGGAVFEIAEGVTLVPGDSVRFVLTPAGRPYLLIVSVDGAGRANVYHPYRGQESAPVDPTRDIEAPADGSIVLDRAPGPERIFALWSQQPVASDRVRPLLEAIGRAGPEAIRRAAALDLPDTLQATLFFEKAGAP
jgi:hypothetical protein